MSLQSFLFVLLASIGYFICRFLCDPVSNPRGNKNRLPHIKYKNIEITPYFRIHIHNKTYHIHHWLNFTFVIILSLIAFEGYQHVNMVRAVAVGGIVQGLRYPDRFKFRHPRQK